VTNLRFVRVFVLTANCGREEQPPKDTALARVKTIRI
jgi:hypothetical protein